MEQKNFTVIEIAKVKNAIWRVLPAFNSFDKFVKTPQANLMQ